MKTIKIRVCTAVLTTLLIVITSNFTFSQETPQPATEPEKEEEPSFTFSGSIDTYFHGAMNTEDAAPGTSFANLKGFSLGMANLIASYGGKKAGFTADLVFGPRGYDAVFGPTYSFSGNPSFGQRVINQLFAYYKVNDAITLNLGQFNTFVGMETITPVPNTHYSTSYSFTNGPFNHTGLRMDVATESGFVAKLAVMNPTDIVEFNPVGTYTLGAQLGVTKEKGGAWLNFLYGDPDGNDEAASYNLYGNLFQVDLTTGWNLTEKFYLGANATYRSLPYEDDATDATSFIGLVLYPKYTVTDNFAVGLRVEDFMVKKGYPVVGPFGLDAEGDGSALAFTLSGNLTSGNLRIIPEIRMDKLSEDAYLVKDETTEFTDQMFTFNLAAVYKF